MEHYKVEQHKSYKIWFVAMYSGRISPILGLERYFNKYVCVCVCVCVCKFIYIYI